MTMPNLYKRCDNPPCHELAVYPAPHCSVRCKKAHDCRINRERHFNATKIVKAKPRKKAKPVMTDDEQITINKKATRAIAERMKQPLDKLAARRCGALW